MLGLIFAIIGLVLLIAFVRFFGAWMLRIDEVIKELKEINNKLDENSGI